MINFHSNKIIVLTGMMGSGKSTIGKNLALKLKRDFIDSDLELSLIHISEPTRRS